MKYKDFEYKIVKNEVVITGYVGNDIAIIIPNKIKGYPVTSIGNSAFSGCSKLTSITIPDNVTSIGDSAFSGCSKLTSITIPDNVTSIGDSAFESCSRLTSVTIGIGVTSIGTWAFLDCSSLIRVYIKDIAKWCSIEFAGYDSNPLYYAHNLYLNDNLVTNLEIPNGVESIGYHAFEGCSSLTSVTIPDNITSIGFWTFCGCSNLTSITIPDSVTSIGDGVFEDCNNLSSIIIPDSAENIGERAFYDCSSLTSITIPSNVTRIDYCAFGNCNSLTSVTIGNGVTRIGWAAFYECSSIKTKMAKYKAFELDKGNLVCMDCTFKENEWSEELDEIECCEKGYHYCTNLFNVFNYYYGELDKDIAIYECEVGDTIDGNDDGSERCTNKIKPVKRLYREDIIRILNGGE